MTRNWWIPIRTVGSSSGISGFLGLRWIHEDVWLNASDHRSGPPPAWVKPGVKWGIRFLLREHRRFEIKGRKGARGILMKKRNQEKHQYGK